MAADFSCSCGCALEVRCTCCLPSPPFVSADGGSETPGHAAAWCSSGPPPRHVLPHWAGLSMLSALQLRSVACTYVPCRLLAECRPRPAGDDLLHGRHPLRCVRHLPAPEGVRHELHRKAGAPCLDGEHRLHDSCCANHSDCPTDGSVLANLQRQQAVHAGGRPPKLPCLRPSNRILTPPCCTVPPHPHPTPPHPRTASTSCTRWRGASRTTCAPRAWTTGTARCLCLTAAWPSAPVSGGGWCLA